MSAEVCSVRMYTQRQEELKDILSTGADFIPVVGTIKSWRVHWESLNTFFGYPPDIRKAIDTTNAIESLCSVIHAAIKKRKVFPTGDSVRKVIYLAIKDASKKWSMPIQNWRLAMSRFIIEFGDRLSDHL